MDKIVIYNPRFPKGGNINDIFAKNKYRHEANSLQKYDKVVADYLLKKYDFLIKVELRDLPKYKKMMESKFPCQYCDYIGEDQKKLRMHIMGKHKITQEVEDLYKDIEEAKPVGEFEGPQAKTIEQQEGIGGEKEGWYGGGLEDDVDSGMMRNYKKTTTF